LLGSSLINLSLGLSGLLGLLGLLSLLGLLGLLSFFIIDDFFLFLKLSKTSLRFLLFILLLLSGSLFSRLLDNLGFNLDSSLFIVILSERFGLLLGWSRFCFGVSGTASKEPVNVYYVLKESPFGLVLLG
jgi:hypothetical protein